jgi:hypothetical protein
VTIILDRLTFASLVAILPSASGLAVAIIYLVGDMPAEPRIITNLSAFAGVALGICCGMFKRT